MKKDMIFITEAEMKALQNFGIEAEICYAIPQKLRNVIASLGKPAKRRFKPRNGTMNEFAYQNKPNAIRASSYCGQVAAKLSALNIKDGTVVSRKLIYGLIPQKEKRSWVVKFLRETGILLPVRP